MNLVETVSTILKREVSENEAKQFAVEQFGVLSAFMKIGKLDKANLSYQLHSAVNVCAGRISTGGDITKSINFLDEEVEEILNGENLY